MLTITLQERESRVMQFFDAKAVRDGLPFDKLIPSLREMFQSGCEVPARHVHEIRAPDGAAMTSLLMPAWVAGRYYGIKVINVAPGNARYELPGLHGSYMLFDANTGVPLALMDGAALTARRTVAASALAASWLARPEASRMLVVGAGALASLLPQAYSAVLPLGKVTVWARNMFKSAMLVKDLREQGVDAHVATDLARAVREAEVISCATLSTEPLVQGGWLQPGSHLDLIGSFTPAMREADDACFAGAAVYVDAEEAWIKSGELIGPMSRGVLSVADVRGTLTGLSRGQVQGRQGPQERTVFKSVGVALEDLAAAILLYEGSVAAT